MVVVGRQDLDMGWARRSTPGKVEGAGGVADDVSDDSSAGMHIQSFFGRPFSPSWGEKRNVWCDIPLNALESGDAFNFTLL
jgi:hypothetical protein